MIWNILAFDPLTHRGDFPSPCIGVCRIDDRSGLCLGCWRTMDEIVRWGATSQDNKRVLWLHVLQRAVAATTATT